MKPGKTSQTTQRKIKLIDRGFQLKLIARFIAINLLVMTIFGGLIYIFFKSEVSANLASAHVTYKNVSQMLFPIVLTLSILNILLISIIIAVAVLYASHKIAGPMYRFNEAMMAMAHKNLHPLTKIRGGDQLQNLSDTMTQLAGTLAADFAKMKDNLRVIRQHLEGLDAPDRVKKLETGLEELETIINEYKF